MKRKLILSLLAALLAVAMLLPLTSCEPKGSEGAETTATPTVEETTPPPTEESRGALIPHTEAMLDLKAEWEKSDAVWAQKLDASLFEDVYENDRVREGEQYLVKIYWNDNEDFEHLMYRFKNILGRILRYCFMEQKMIVCCLDPHTIQLIAEPILDYGSIVSPPQKRDADIRIASAKDILNRIESMESSTEREKGALISHSEEMSELKSKWETSNEVWVQKLDGAIFTDYYEGDRARDGERYLVKICWNDFADFEFILYRWRKTTDSNIRSSYLWKNTFSEKVLYFSGEEKMLVAYMMPAELYELAMPLEGAVLILSPEKREVNISILSAKGVLDLLESVDINK